MKIGASLPPHRSQHELEWCGLSESAQGNEIIGEIPVESDEGLDQLDFDLVALEQCGANAEVIGRVFRCVHTTKGTGRFLGFGRLQSVAHAGEKLLSKVRV